MSAGIVRDSTTERVVKSPIELIGRWRHCVATLLTFGLGLALYWPSLHGPRLFDDDVMLSDVGSVTTIRELVTSFNWLRPETRPLVRLTFGIEACLLGDKMWVHRLGNVLIHVLAAGALFGLVRKICQTATSGSSTCGFIHTEQTAFVVAILWFVHPLQSAAVAYVAQRGESLMGLLFFLYLRCVAELITTRSTRWLIAAIVVFCAGLSSKTIMITVPAVGLLMDRAFYSGSWMEVLRGQWKLMLFPVVGSLLAVALLLPGIFKGEANVGFGGDAPPIDLHLAAQAKVLWLYAFQGIWPQRLSVDHAMRPPQYMSDQLGWILLTGLLISVIAGLYWFRKFVVGFLLLAPLVVLSVTSSFIPTADLWVDHRMYVPLAFVITMLVVCLRKLLLRIHEAERSVVVFLWATAVLGLLFATRTWVRSSDYASGTRIWRSAIAENPDNDRAVQNLIDATRKESPESSILPVLDQALQAAEESGIVPTVALGRLGEHYTERGESERAIGLLSRAMRLDEQHFFEGYRDARRNSERFGMHVNMSLALASLGQISEALVYMNSAFQFADGSADARALAGSLSLQAGDIAAAEHHFQRALELRPGWKDVEADLERIRQLR